VTRCCTSRLAIAVALALVAPRSVAVAAPRDFTPEARALYEIAACGEPPPRDDKVRVAHCKQTAAAVATWRAKWRDLAAPFFAELLKGGYPNAVVYPFGGGDLATALVVYPDATEYTTLSLEGMGDPRPIATIRDRAHLARELARLRETYAKNLAWAWNTTIQLSLDSSEGDAAREALPGILALALVALADNGYEPLEVRYFRLGADGAPVYLTDEDVAAVDAAAKPTRRTHKPTNAVQQGAFDDVEIVFRARGDAAAPKKIFRHVTADLSDGALARDGAALAYLDKRDGIAALTKAASYLLWKPEFGTLRASLLARAKLMISDDTGIPPRYAAPAGFTHDVWGSYAGPHFSFANREVASEMVALWKAAPARSLPFRFGYYDKRGRAVLLYMHR
jgi:hypothetical protein